MRSAPAAQRTSVDHTLTVPDAHTGMLNSYRVWLSGITYKASAAD